jgi:cbb3-type cytochrome oxidase subunit 3
MRWLMIVLLVSVVALLIASAGVAYHVWREHTRRRDARAAVGKMEDNEPEEAP